MLQRGTGSGGGGDALLAETLVNAVMRLVGVDYDPDSSGQLDRMKSALIVRERSGYAGRIQLVMGDGSFL